MADATVTERRPPRALLRVANPPLRALLLSPAGRFLPVPVAVLEFAGRRTGRLRRIVVTWYEGDDGPMAFTPAPWRHNFAGGRAVTVVVRGRRRHGTGTLVDAPATVAAALQRLLDGGASPQMFGLDMPAGHRLTAEDVRGLGRAMIRFELGEERLPHRAAPRGGGAAPRP